LASKEEELLAELLDESSSFAQEMKVRLKRSVKIMYKLVHVIVLLLYLIIKKYYHLQQGLVFLI